ncbi:MAG: cell envelope integrity protein TolA [Pseudomonadota bacterium]
MNDLASSPAPARPAYSARDHRFTGLLFSLLVHAGVVALLSVSVNFTPNEIGGKKSERIINAVMVDSAQVEAELAKLKAADADRQREAQALRREEERRAAEAKKAKEQELKRLEELKAEKQRLSKERQLEDQRRKEAEQQRQAAETALKKQQDAERAAAAEREKERKLEAQRQAEAKRKEEERQRAQAEREQKEAEARAAEIAQRDAEQRASELAAEEAALEAQAQARRDEAQLARYVAAIRNRVISSFTVLPGLEGLVCTLRISLIPGGEVAGVQVVRSSGNATFDRQAENAVRKAAPLPVPEQPRLFEKMRNINFVFDPQG